MRDSVTVEMAIDVDLAEVEVEVVSFHAGVAASSTLCAVDNSGPGSSPELEIGSIRGWWLDGMGFQCEPIPADVLTEYRGEIEERLIERLATDERGLRR